MEIDLGDAVLFLNLRVRGLRRFRMRWHVGAPREKQSRPVAPLLHICPSLSKEYLVMDLQADKEVDLSVQFTDEVGNPVPAPADAVVVFSVDDPTIIDLTDHGDGTAVAGATGTLGSALVHVEVTGDFPTVTGDLSLVVVAGVAERVTVVASEPRERTPD